MCIANKNALVVELCQYSRACFFDSHMFQATSNTPISWLPLLLFHYFWLVSVFSSLGALRLKTNKNDLKFLTYTHFWVYLWPLCLMGLVCVKWQRPLAAYVISFESRESGLSINFELWLWAVSYLRPLHWAFILKMTFIHCLWKKKKKKIKAKSDFVILIHSRNLDICLMEKNKRAVVDDSPKG